ncbi:MAG: hypothetical protein ACI85J_001613 [Candidatus Poriferisodalaceae bacterium]|jgi:hypothetical protein
MAGPLRLQEVTGTSFWKERVCGGGGNRTRVLQRFNESSPSAVTEGIVGVKTGRDTRFNTRT